MLSILLVEDDPDQRSSIAEALQEHHTVMAVADAGAALASHPERFDLVLTDLRMPGLSGVELKARLDEDGVNVPMVLMSSDPHCGSQAVSAGFFDSLSKPLSVDRLEAVIARVEAEKHRPISLLGITPTPPETPPDHPASPDEPGPDGA